MFVPRHVCAQTCLGTNMYGHKRVWAQTTCIWAQTCMGTNVYGHKQHVYGHKRVWAQTCMGTNVSGHKHVWAQTCMGTNVSGHKRVWAQTWWNPLEYNLQLMLGKRMPRYGINALTLNLSNIYLSNICPYKYICIYLYYHIHIFVCIFYICSAPFLVNFLLII